MLTLKLWKGCTVGFSPRTPHSPPHDNLLTAKRPRTPKLPRRVPGIHPFHVRAQLPPQRIDVQIEKIHPRRTVRRLRPSS